MHYCHRVVISTNDVLAMLDELIELTTIDEESPQSFKVRAYDKAKRALEDYGEVVGLSERELCKIDGVGKATASKVREFVETGTVAKLESLRAEYPPQFSALARIPGIGPKTLKTMRSQLSITNLDELRSAIEAQQLRNLPRMGAKSEERIANALVRLDLHSDDKRTPVADATSVANRLLEAFLSLDSVTEAKICGSLRRMAETVGDIDIVVASREPAGVMRLLLARPEVVETLVSGGTKSSVVTREGLQVDVRVVDPECFGAATLYFTGSKLHNIELRKRAIGRGLTLNEYGLFERSETGELDANRVVADQSPAGQSPGPKQSDLDSKRRGSDDLACQSRHLDGAGDVHVVGEPLTARTETEIYAGLGLAFIPAPMREGTGEITSAESSELDEIVQRADIQGDLHYHTARSGDGRSSVQEMIDVAAAAGYRYLAITDHGEDLAINGSSAHEMLEHRDHIAAIAVEYDQMHIMWGCELNIGQAGELDYDADFRSQFDYTVASVHSHFDQSRSRQTERLVSAIADPTVDSIGHLTGRYIGKRPGIDLEIDIVLEALAHFDVALEINGSLNRLDASAEVVARAVDRGVKLVINTDSHHVSELGRMEYGVKTAQRGWASRDLVINTWDPQRLLSWVSSHRSQR